MATTTAIVNNVEKHGKKNMLFGTILGYISIALSLVSSLLFAPLIVKSIGNSGYAIYSLAQSTINFFILDMGLGMATLVFLARYRAEEKTEEISNFLGITYKLYALLDLCFLAIFVVYYFLIDYVQVGLTISERDVFKKAYLIAACFSLCSFPLTTQNAVLQAYEEFVWIKICDIFYKILFVSLSALALFLNWGLFALVAIQAGSSLISSLIKWLLVRQKLHIKGDLRVKTFQPKTKEIFLFSVWSAVVLISGRLSETIIPTVLSIVSDSKEIAAMSAITTIYSSVVLIGDVMGGVITPKIARIRKSGNQNALIAFAVKIGKIELFICFLIFAGFISFGQEFVQLWMDGNEAYTTVYPSVIILMSIYFFKLPFTFFGRTLYVDGEVKRYALNYLVGSVVCATLAFLFGHFWGAIGASLAICAGEMVSLALDVPLYKKHFGIKFKGFLGRTYFRPLCVFLIAVLVGLYFHFTGAIASWTSLVEGAFTIIFLYLLISFFALTNQERLFFLGRYSSIQDRSSRLDKGTPKPRTKKERILLILLMFVALLSNEDFLLIGTGSNRYIKAFAYLLLGLMGLFFVLMWMKGKFRLNSKMMALSITLFVLVLLSSIANQDVGVDKSFKYFLEFANILFALFFCSYFRIDDFSKCFIVFVTTTAIVSFIFLGIYKFLPSIFLKLPSFSSYNGTKIYSFLWTFMVKESDRMFGFGHEPGIFGIYLSIALFLELFIVKRRKVEHLLIALILILASYFTKSTTSFFGIALILLARFAVPSPSKKIRMIKLAFSIFFCIIFAVLVMTNFSWLKTNEITGKLFTSNGSINSRLYGALLSLEPAFYNPIFGAGWTKGLSWSYVYASEWALGDFSTTNTFAIEMMAHGILSGIIFLTFLYDFAAFSKSPLSTAISFISFFIIFACDNLTTSLLILFLLYYGANNSTLFAKLKCVLLPKALSFLSIIGTEK